MSKAIQPPPVGPRPPPLGPTTAAAWAYNRRRLGLQPPPLGPTTAAGWAYNRHRWARNHKPRFTPVPAPDCSRSVDGGQPGQPSANRRWATKPARFCSRRHPLGTVLCCHFQTRRGALPFRRHATAISSPPRSAKKEPKADTDKASGAPPDSPEAGVPWALLCCPKDEALPFRSDVHRRQHAVRRALLAIGGSFCLALPSSM